MGVEVGVGVFEEDFGGGEVLETLGVALFEEVGPCEKMKSPRRTPARAFFEDDLGAATGFFEKGLAFSGRLLDGTSESATAPYMVEFDAIELDAKEEGTTQGIPLFEKRLPKREGGFEIKCDLSAIDEFDVVLQVKGSLVSGRECALDGLDGLFGLIFGE